MYFIGEAQPTISEWRPWLFGSGFRLGHDPTPNRDAEAQRWFRSFQRGLQRTKKLYPHPVKIAPQILGCTGRESSRISKAQVSIISTFADLPNFQQSLAPICDSSRFPQLPLGFRIAKMEASAAVSTEEGAQSASYTYWVRGVSSDAAPLPVPKKIDPADLSNQPNQTHLGSAWNRAGTWEERSLNKWATDRIKELLVSMGSLEFSGGKAEITEVTRCSGDAILVTVRNKKRVGYNYELTLKVNGEWDIEGEKKKVKCHIDVPEFSYGELDDLQIQVRLGEDVKTPQDKHRLNQDLKLFLQPLREKLLQFEEELKSR
ncbi:uncharacterized protein LOC127252106 [Andrographis paniculata]|uniref:uncharacterized protein LOC127252106 n=1 Tax=Andrographis paniculata TaxID=175694 RepID=UPI0021E995B7|nr:uncharacterized protein LOC127252106 [Andrographis paniculata]